MASGKFEETIKAYTQPGPDRRLTGAVVAAANLKGNEYMESFGTTALDSSEPLKNDAVMWFASCTKLLTSICALQCVERGQFSLDSTEDVERLVPETNNPIARQVFDGKGEDGKYKTKPATKRATLRHLLTHSSGFAYDFWGPSLEWRMMKGEAPAQALTGQEEKYFDLPLEHEPGEGWAYSVGLDIAGMMVARANKTTLREYMAEHIWKAVGMTDSAFSVQQNPEPFKKRMKMASRAAEDQPLTMDLDASWVWPNDRLSDSGGAGMFSTAPDYLKVLKSVLHNDGKLLKPASVDMLFAPQLSSTEAISTTMATEGPYPYYAAMAANTPIGIEWQHGLGGRVSLQDVPRFRKGFLSWGGAPCIRWWIDRSAGTCGVFATQLMPTGEMKQRVIGDLFEEKVYEEMAVKA